MLCLLMQESLKWENFLCQWCAVHETAWASWPKTISMIF